MYSGQLFIREIRSNQLLPFSVVRFIPLQSCRIYFCQRSDELGNRPGEWGDGTERTVLNNRIEAQLRFSVTPWTETHTSRVEKTRLQSQRMAFAFSVHSTERWVNSHQAGVPGVRHHVRISHSQAGIDLPRSFCVLRRIASRRDRPRVAVSLTTNKYFG
jgi:hypothetical protein